MLVVWPGWILLMPIAMCTQSPHPAGPSEIAGDYFGTCVAGAGDVDGDGFPDILVASGARTARPVGDPSVVVFSGQTGKLLLALAPDTEISGFENRCACGMGDVDRDGHADIALAAWRRSEAGRQCVVTAFSGANGSALWSSCVDPWNRPGLHRDLYLPPPSFVCLTGDIDGDGVSDLAAGTWLSVDPPGSGHLELLSGRTGCMITGLDEEIGIWRWEGPPVAIGDLDQDGVCDLLLPVAVRDSRGEWAGRFGFEARSGVDLHELRLFEVSDCAEPRCGAIGDVDRDGIPDLLVSGYVSDAASGYLTFARILSGRDGGVIAEFRNLPCDFKGSDVCGIEDVDGDGWNDILLSEYEVSGRCSGVWLLSGRDAHPIRRFPMPTDPSGFASYLGYAIAAAGDVDRDGVPDIAMGTATPWGEAPGYAEIYSGRNGALLHRWSRANLTTEKLGGRR